MKQPPSHTLDAARVCCIPAASQPARTMCISVATIWWHQVVAWLLFIPERILLRASAGSTLTFVRAIVVVCNDFSGHPHAVQLWGRSQPAVQFYVCSALVCYQSVVRESKSALLDAFSALKFSFITSPHYQQNF